MPNALICDVNLHKICVFTKKSKKILNDKSLENLKDNKTKEFSKKAQKRLLDKTEAFLSAYKRNEIVFCTLTLPAKQMHCDIEVKTKILNRFFNLLKKEIGNFNYLWKAEKQKNENIHFHFLTHKKFHYSILEKVWNKVLDEFGYIEKYQEKFKGMSFEDYKKYRLSINPKTEFSKIKEAYKKGIESNWSNPNTTDIKMLRNIKSVASYICKYMKKDKKDKIEGRFWGASDGVKELNPLRVILHDGKWKVNRKLQDCLNQVKEENILIFDYCTVYFINILNFPYLKQLYIQYGKHNKKVLNSYLEYNLP